MPLCLLLQIESFKIRLDLKFGTKIANIFSNQNN